MGGYEEFLLHIHPQIALGTQTACLCREKVWGVQGACSLFRLLGRPCIGEEACDIGMQFRPIGFQREHVVALAVTNFHRTSKSRTD